MPLRFALHEFFADLSRASSRVDAFAMLARRAEQALAADRVLIAIFDEAKGVWVGYTSAGGKEWIGRELRLFASITVIEGVRKSHQTVRDTFRFNTLHAESWRKQSIRHAVAVPLFHLATDRERQAFAGCLYMDRRDDLKPFTDSEAAVALHVACAAEAGLLALEHADAVRFSSEDHPAVDRMRRELLRSIVTRLRGNVARMVDDPEVLACFGSGVTRMDLRQALARYGLEAERQHARRSVNPDELLRLLRETQDLFATAERFGGKSYRGMTALLEKFELGSSLEAWATANGVDWEQVRGPQFKRSKLYARVRPR